MVFRILNGKSDDVDLSGRTVALALDFPGPTLFDGNGTARMYLDRATTVGQRKELEAIISREEDRPDGDYRRPGYSNWSSLSKSLLDVPKFGDI